jgi:hypothetical protein
MKKLALIIALTASVLIAASSIVLAAFRVDSGFLFDAGRNASLIVERGGNPRIVYVNERLYPDTVEPELLAPAPSWPGEDEIVAGGTGLIPRALREDDMSTTTAMTSAVEDAVEIQASDSDELYRAWCNEGGCLAP